MNNIQYGQGSGTFSSVLLVGFGVVLGSNLMQGYQQTDDSSQDSRSLYSRTYSVEGNATSYNLYASAFTGEYGAVAKSFDSAISDVYARLMINQEPLGVEFERVLNENLWDLYES